MKNNGNPGKEERIIIHADPDLEDLIPGFLENRREDVESISDALKKGEFEKVKILGHSMKGSGGGYGFDRISEIGKDLENAAKEKNTEAIKTQLQHLSTYLERVDVVFD